MAGRPLDYFADSVRYPLATSSRRNLPEFNIRFALAIGNPTKVATPKGESRVTESLRMLELEGGQPGGPGFALFETWDSRGSLPGPGCPRFPAFTNPLQNQCVAAAAGHGLKGAVNFVGSGKL